ncbi:probable beta-glucosidase I [Aspergillus lentulus]|uniref:beta-glucosidase n=1 Tax=Aspergillus lentulus TaxID=293939 RepID=A0AAN4PJ38_ASPLE|nr:probable beta-glucosidase I [Aspergillus lentulus]
MPLLSRLTKSSSGLVGFDMKVFLDPPSNPNRKVFDSLYVNTSDIFLANYKNPQDQGEPLLSDSGWDVYTRRDIRVPIQPLSVWNRTSKSYHIHIAFGTLPTRTFNVVGATAFGAGGLRAGGTRKIDLKSELEKAAFMVTQFDQVILCAGLNGDWESEGYYRSTMDLPPGTDELIDRVVAANPNTGVIIQSGTPVSMPWANRVPALIHAWYGGNETGNAIADVVFGTSERRRTVYDEGVYIGYRFYEKCKRDVAFPFGHGLSYTTFELSSLSSLSLEETGDELIVALDVHNSGDVDGAEVVQVYVGQILPRIWRPIKGLKGFPKVFVAAGKSERVKIHTSKNCITRPRNPISTTLIEPTGGLNLNSHGTGNFTPLTRQVRDGSSQSEIRDHTTEWHAERPLRPGIRAGSVTGPWLTLRSYSGSVPSTVGGYTREYFEN